MDNLSLNFTPLVPWPLLGALAVAALAVLGYSRAQCEASPALLAACIVAVTK